jgi:hypothetical protein
MSSYEGIRPMDVLDDKPIAMHVEGWVVEHSKAGVLAAPEKKLRPFTVHGANASMLAMKL